MHYQAKWIKNNLDSSFTNELQLEEKKRLLNHYYFQYLQQNHIK